MNDENNIQNINTASVEDNNEIITTTTAYVSEPYRYRYEKGEKTEVTKDTQETSNYQTEDTTHQPNPIYDTYHYHNTDSFYTTTEAEPTPSKKKKKNSFVKKALKWTAKAACFGIVAGTAFFGVNYVASKAFRDTSLEINSKASLGGVGTELNFTIGSTNTIESAENPAATPSSRQMPFV